MPPKPVRRRHSAELKSRVLAACDEPGASVAAVALAHELNANLVHKWRRRMAGAAAPAIRLGAPAPSFVALSVPNALPGSATLTSTPTAGADIRIAIERRGGRVDVRWPVAAAAECAAWLREWLR